MTIFFSIISFLTSSIGKYLLIGAVVLAAVIGIRQNGYNAAMRKCEAAALRQQLANKQTDLDAANAAAEVAAAAMAESDARARENQQRADDYEAELKLRPNGACALTGDDLRVLRGNDKSRAR